MNRVRSQPVHACVAMCQFHCSHSVLFYDKITGAFLDEDDVVSLNVLDIAISRQNVFNTKFRLEPIIKKISPMDGFNAEQAGNTESHHFNVNIPINLIDFISLFRQFVK